MADLYASLTPAQQTAFRTALYARISQSACPTVDVSGSGITGPDSLIDAGNRGIAIDCFQTANKTGGGGVLDHATYVAIVGGMPTWEKMVFWASAAVGGLWLLGKMTGKHKGRRR